MKASDVLRERGWCQGSMSDKNGRVCAFGAIGAVTGSPYSHNPGDDELKIVVEFVIDWNDTPGRRQDEVEKVFDAAYVLALQTEGVEPEDVLR